jgi:hypothetical protein
MHSQCPPQPPHWQAWHHTRQQQVSSSLHQMTVLQALYWRCLKWRTTLALAMQVRIRNCALWPQICACTSLGQSCLTGTCRAPASWSALQLQGTSVLRQALAWRFFPATHSEPAAMLASLGHSGSAYLPWGRLAHCFVLHSRRLEMIRVMPSSSRQLQWG